MALSPARPALTRADGLHIRYIRWQDRPGLEALRAGVGWETASVPGQLAAADMDQRDILVAVLDGVLVGAIAVEWRDERRPDLADGETVAHVNDRAVLPEYQGRGVGGQLMDAAERAARALGYCWLAAQVPPELPHVYAECLRRGYVDTGTRNGFAVLKLDLGAENE